MPADDPGNETDESGDTFVDGTPLVRDFIDEKASNGGTRDAASADIQSSHVAVGSQEQFNVINLSTRSYYTTTATVEAETANAVIYVEGGVDDNPNIDADDVDRIVAAFEDEVRPQLEDQFGTWHDENNDGKLAILVFDIPAPRPGIRLNGYHSSQDYTNGANSNQRDMVYMNELLRLDGSDQFNETLTQEVQHAVNFNLSGANPNDMPATWLDEAVANYAEFEVYGTTKPGPIGTYESNPAETGLTRWGGRIADYGASFLFAMYLSEHYGDLAGNDGFMADLIRQNADGTAAVDDTLADYGFDDRFEDAFRNWTIANHLDDDSIADAYGYNNLSPSVDTTTRTVDGSGQTISDQVNRTGAAYVEVTADTESFYYEVQNANIDPFVVTDTGSESSVQSGLADTIDPNETVRTDTGNVSGAISQSAQQSALPSVPVINANNTITNADAYDEVTVVLPRTGGTTNYDLSLDRVPDENRFSGTLSDGETASYVIPVNRYGTPTLTSVYEHNGDVFTSVWSTGSGTVDATLTDADGDTATELTTPAGSETVEHLGENPLTMSNVWRLDVNATAADAPFRVATTYSEGPLDGNQVFTLPSDLEVSPNGRNLQAGSNDSTKSIQFTVNVSTAGRGYTYGPFAEPDPSHFDVTIGKESVDTSNISIVSNTQGQYDLVVNPPAQPSNGQYDLNVSFTDEKFGVNGTAATTLDGGVSYSGQSASGSASVVLVMDESGSMEFEDAVSPPLKIERAKTAANQFLNQFSAGDRVSIVSFNSSSYVRSGLQRFGGNEMEIRNSIDRITAGGGTKISAGMQDGLDQLDQSPNRTNQAAIVMTDGESQDLRQIFTLANTYDARGYCVYTVAFGSGAKDALLQDIADENCGDFRDTEAAGTDIGDIYRDLGTTTGGLVTFNKTSGTVDADNSTTQTFSLDDTTDSSVVSVTTGDAVSPSSASGSVSAATSGDVDVLLFYPNGTQVQRNSSTSSGTENPDIVYTSTGDTQTYRINDPRPGDWTYEVENNADSSTTYQTDVSGSTQTTVTVVTDGDTYVNGSDAELSTVLVGPKGGISGASATATIETPNGSTRQVSLVETSSGQYTATVPVTQTGQYAATVDISKDDIDRQKTVTWQTIDESSLIDINETETANVTEGNNTAITLNVTRPSSPSPAVSSHQSDASTFDSVVRELAALPRDEIETANVSDATRQAALQLRAQRQEADSSSELRVTAATSGSSGVGVYVQTSALTGQNGTIQPSNVQAALSTFSLQSGDSENLRITVTVPQGTPPGVYNGTVTLLVGGTQVETPISVTVTDAGKTTYQAQIVEAADLWEDASPMGKDYYEAEIADTLTTIYFDDSAEQGAALTAGSNYWRGQTLSFETNFGSAGKTYQLHEADRTSNGWEVGSPVREIGLDGTGSATVTTDSLDGDYVIVDENGNPVTFDDSGDATGTGSVADARFEVSVQSLSADFNASSVARGNSTSVELNSNRAGYTLTVDQDSLTVADLESVFGQSDADADRRGYQIEINSQSTTIDADFTSVATGSYTFDFEVPDSGAVASASVSVTSPATSTATGNETEVAS